MSLRTPKFEVLKLGGNVGNVDGNEDAKVATSYLLSLKEKVVTSY